MTSFTEHYIDRNPGRVHAREYAGADPPFVMLHGLPDNSGIYNLLAPLLAAAGRRVVTFDFLGYGKSDILPTAAYSYEQQLGDLKAVVDALRLGEIVPVVHDSGGCAGINFAIDYPERVNSLVILNCAFSDGLEVRWPELVEVFARPTLSALASAIGQSAEQFGWLVNFQALRFREKLAEKHRANFDSVLIPVIKENFLSKPSAGPAFAQMAGGFFAELARNTARIPKLEALDVDARIIWSDADPYVTLDGGKYLQAHMKSATLDVVPGGHWLQIDEPEMVARLMLELR